MSTGVGAPPYERNIQADGKDSLARDDSGAALAEDAPERERAANEIASLREHAHELATRLATVEASLARETAKNVELASGLARESAALLALQREHQAVINSKAWRITRPLRAVRNLMRSLRPEAAACRPLRDVESLGQSRYVATGNNPQLLLDLKSPRLQAGWYRLRASLAADKTSALAPEMYFDRGSGFQESDRVGLSLPRNGLLDELIELPFGALAARLDPVAVVGTFTVRNLRLNAMTRAEAATRTIWRHARRVQKRSLVAAWLVWLRGIAAFVKTGRLPYYRAAAMDPALNVIPTALARTPQRGYELVSHPAGYTYIPPRPPDDLACAVTALTKRPKLSVIVPVYNTPPELLRKLITSVTSQWYPHWELIFADDASSAAETRDVLAAVSDQRIVVHRLEANQGIAGATNAALALASGEYVVFLDHDDELTEDCLFELAQCISKDDPDFVYSDEDKLSPDGDFVEPHFKPDWSPDTMMSTMYTCHVSCARRALIQEVGGLRSEYDGCQDWDLVLRLTEKTRRVSHIPKVLYHWRIIPNSIAAKLTAKPYAIDTSRRLRVDALERRGLHGTVEPVPEVPGHFRVSYQLQGSPVVSIIIPTRDNRTVLARCLDTIEARSTYPKREIVILDNGSRDSRTLSYLESLKGRAGVAVIRHDAPFNFSEINNLGAKAAKGEVLLFLNDDTEVITDDWLERLGGYAQLSHVGAVGAKLLYPGLQHVQHAGILNLADGPGHAFLRQPPASPGYFARNLLEYDWLAVTGACLAIERKKLLAVGGFDESFPIAYNDVELCMRLHDAGFYNVVCQAVRLVHHESITRGHDDQSAEKLARLKMERRRLYERHVKYFQFDPFHNPNLHPNGINFELAN